MASKESNALVISSSLSTSKEPAHVPLGPSIFGPDVKILGPTNSLLAIAFRHSKTEEVRSPPASRTVVIPFAINSFKKFLFTSIKESPPLKCVWLSQKPGTMYFPVASIVAFASTLLKEASVVILVILLLLMKMFDTEIVPSSKLITLPFLISTSNETGFFSLQLTSAINKVRATIFPIIGNLIIVKKFSNGKLKRISGNFLIQF